MQGMNNTKLIGTQLLQKVSVFYRTEWLTTVFTTSHSKY